MMSERSEGNAITAVRLEMMRRGASKADIDHADDCLHRLGMKLAAHPPDLAGAAPARRQLAEWVVVAQDYVGEDFMQFQMARASLTERVEGLARASWLSARGR